MTDIFDRFTFPRDSAVCWLPPIEQLAKRKKGRNIPKTEVGFDQWLLDAEQ